MTYDRQGRLSTTTDASGTLTRTYHPSGQLQNEAYGPTGVLANLGITREFDSFDRLSGLGATSVALGSPQPLGGGGSVTYGYDGASRLQTVASGANSATYGYLANSPLVETVTFKSGSETRLATTKAYDYLNRITSVTNTPSASSAQSVVYTYNSANQRIRATHEDGAYWQYAYDPLGQVTSGVKHLPAGDTVLGHDFAWTFDDIGNRRTATKNGAASAYTPNALNQYSQRTAPGAIDVLGAAAPDATVTVTQPPGSTNIRPTARQGELFFEQLAVDNSASPQYAALKVTGVKNNVGLHGEDAMSEETRHAFLAQTPETFTYDADGNLAQDGRLTYAWDAENRLIGMETRADVAAGLPDLSRQKLEFSYDAQGRRIEKRVSNWNPASGLWDPASDVRFLYDGWNLVSELDALNGNAVVRSHVWGLDLSGSPQGAGGVGGLLFTSNASSTQFASFDGNGNVIGLVDGATGTRCAEFEYGAFGETLTSSEPGASLPFRFSTKYADWETGLAYYGFRYLSTLHGRWLSRDPIGEDGGLNLYGFVNNSPLNYVDTLGLVSSLETADPALLAQFGLGNGLPSAGTIATVGTAVGVGAGAIAVKISQDRPNEDARPNVSSDSATSSCPKDPCKGLEQQLAQHIDKLAKYKANPDAYDNLNLLKLNPQFRDRIIAGRIRNLESQISNFQRLLENCRKMHPKP